MATNSEGEVQLPDSEDSPINRKRHKYYDMATKLEAIQWARANSINSASRKFNVDRKCVKHWMTQEYELNSLVSTPGGSKRKRLDGGGRSVLHPDLDEELACWVRQMRECNQAVSRRIISNKATQLFSNTDVKISNGWLSSFMKRHHFVHQRQTTICQKEPESYAEAVANFFVGVEEKRKAELSATTATLEDNLNTSFKTEQPIHTNGLNLLYSIRSETMTKNEKDYIEDTQLSGNELTEVKLESIED